MHDDLPQRKSQHLDLVQRPDVEPEGSDPLFHCVRLLHRALPELALSEIDLRAELCGKPLRAPLMIVGMTGGTERAGQVNRDLALLAQEAGVAFGVGSMRVLLDEPQLLPTFAVESRPPVLMANLGAQQLVQRGSEAALKLIELLKADGICIHLNAAQELVQGDGDRDFRGCLEAIEKLAKQLGPRMIVKETGCGLSPQTVRQLAGKGVKAVDVSGLGGTSWPRVEQLRAQTSESRELGGQLSGWGIPTAACVAAARAAEQDVKIIASGGIRDGFDAARALALGADLAGVALPFVRAHHAGGLEAARALLNGFISSLQAALLLCGVKDIAALRASKPIILEPLRSWIDGLTSPSSRDGLTSASSRDGLAR